MTEVDPALSASLLSEQSVIDVDSQKTLTKENKENKDDSTPVPEKKDEKPKETKPKQPKPPNWRIEEDQSLCTAWLNTSKDATTVNYQMKTTFWDQINALYLQIIGEVTEKKKNTKGFKPFPTRLKKPLEDRWYHIQHQVNKYCGYYAQLQQRMWSGSSNADLVM
jgi:ribosomal protein L32